MAFPDDVYDPFLETAFDETGTGTAISDETVDVPASSPYRVDLKYIAKNDGSIQVWTAAGQSGTELTEITTGSPSANEYLVDYNFARVTFDASRASETLYVTYTSLGSVRRVVDTNEARNEIVDVETWLLNNLATNLIQEDVTLWVDATSGSDSNPGTEAEPFQTLNKALESARDVAYLNATLTVNMMPGTYATNSQAASFFSRALGIDVTLNWLALIQNCHCLGSAEVIVQRAPLESGLVLISNGTDASALVKNADCVTFKNVRFQNVAGLAWQSVRSGKLDAVEVYVTVDNSFNNIVRHANLRVEDSVLLGANNGVDCDEASNVDCLSTLIWGHPNAGLYVQFGSIVLADSDTGSGLPYSVTSVTNPSGNTYRYNVSETIGEPDLTFASHIVAVDVGGGNDGWFAITDIQSGYIEVSNAGGSAVGSPPPGASVFQSNGGYGALASFNGVGYVFGDALRGGVARGETDGGQQVNP